MSSASHSLSTSIIGTLSGWRGEDAVHRLALPEAVVGRMRGDLPPEADLVDAVLRGRLARRTGGMNAS